MPFKVTICDLKAQPTIIGSSVLIDRDHRTGRTFEVPNWNLKAALSPRRRDS